MAETILVKSDMNAGQELLRILDESGFPVTAAAWIYFPHAEEWRLVMRTPKAAASLQQALLELARAMDAKGDLRQRIDLARVRLVPPNDRMLEALGTTIRADGLKPVRFNRNVINGIYIDDALIYRLAA